jgi:NADH-quinone oxidoreductase subunit E
MEAKLDVNTVDILELENTLKSFKPGDEGRLIPVLQAAQEIYGYLPPPVLDRISEYLKVPLVQVYGVATFYAQFSLKPRGKNIIKVCTGTSCHVRGGQLVLEALEKTLGVEAGETTTDMKFTLETVACLGTCFLSPVMMINDKYYGKLTPHKAEEIITQF